MDCASSIVKYIMYIFNICCLIIGVLLIVFGSLMIGNLDDIKDINDAVNMDTLPILVIVLGCIVFLVSFFGCCGAIRENVCLMTTYGVCMFILFVLQVALIVWVFVQWQTFINTMSDFVDETWQSNTAAQGYPMDALQMTFKCCGKTNYLDYQSIGATVPSSCCGTLTGDCPATEYMLKQGCRSAFLDFWTSNMNIIRYVGIGVAVVELVALTFACCLSSSMRRSRGHNF